MSINRFTTLLVVCFTVVLAAGCGGVVSDLQNVGTAGENFMSALRDNNYSQAYNLCGDSLQKELSSPQGLESLIKNGNVHPAKWNISSRNVNGDQGQLEGSVTFDSGKEGDLRITLGKAGSDWKVIGFNMKQK